KRTIGFLAGGIKASWREGKSTGVFYDECAKRAELSTLQKILAQGEAHENTRGKLLIAYKAALAESDANIGSLADAVDFSKLPSYDVSDHSFIGLLFWAFLDPYALGALIRELRLKPPTLACVRRYFVRLYLRCK